MQVLGGHPGFDQDDQAVVDQAIDDPLVPAGAGILLLPATVVAADWLGRHIRSVNGWGGSRHNDEGVATPDSCPLSRAFSVHWGLRG